MHSEWQLQEAKGNFSQLIKRAASGDALHVWAQIAAHAELAGQPMPVMDGLLMATAQCHGLTVVTRNVQDFALHPQVFNPWAL